MKIALIVPEFLSGTSFIQPPLGMLYVARLLEQQGHSVIVEDVRTSHISLDTLVRRVKDCDIAVITSTPYDQIQNYFVDYRYAYTVNTVRYIKEHIKTILVVVCGAHSTVRSDLVLSDTGADLTVRGEYIYALLRIVTTYAKHMPLEELPNIAYVRGGEYIETTTSMSLWHPDIPDDLFPDYKKVDMSAYFGVQYVNNHPLRKARRGVIQASRGCPFSCIYCHNFWGKQVRKRSAESIVSELELLQSSYGVEEVFFIDFTFTLDRQWVADICEQIVRKSIDLELTVETRVDLLDKQLLQCMRSAGFRNIWLGVESFSDDVLSVNCKGHSVDTAVRAIELIKESNISPHVFVMLGMPGETCATLNRTIQTIYSLRIPYTRSIMICTPRYGTAYYDLARDQFPEVSEGFHQLNVVKGLVANEMTPSMLLKAKTVLEDRSFFYQPRCPQI